MLPSLQSDLGLNLRQEGHSVARGLTEPNKPWGQKHGLVLYTRGHSPTGYAQLINHEQMPEALSLIFGAPAPLSCVTPDLSELQPHL